MLMPGRYVSDTSKRCMTITRSGWTTIMVDSCKPLIATATSLYTLGNATAVYNGSHLVFSSPTLADAAGFVAQVAAGVDNSFEFNIAKLDNRSDQGVLVTVLETIDNVQYVIGGGHLQLGTKQRVNFRSTGNNVSLLFTGPFNVVEIAQVCTKYPKSVQHTYLVDVCDEDKDRYRFGFNGMEKDNELKGVGNSLDFGARMYDARVARWLSLDPLAQKYPGISPYAFVANSPIRFVDPDGREIKDALIKGTLYEPIFNKVMSLDVMKGVLKPIIESTTSHYTLTYLPYALENSAGQSYEGRKGSSRTNYNSIIGGTEMFTLGAKITLSEIGMAQTVIHESFHGIIFKGLNDGSIKRKEVRGDEQEHNYLAKHYQPKILEALTEYDEKQKLGIGEEGLKALSWVGLEGTEAYDEEYKDDESKKKQQTTASTLLYNIEQANTETSKPNDNNNEKNNIKDK